VQVRTLINNGVQGIIAVPPPLRPICGRPTGRDEVYDSTQLVVRCGQHGERRSTISACGRRSTWSSIATSSASTRSAGPGSEEQPCELISGPFVQSSPYYNRTVSARDRRSAKAQSS
jgi:hypothetical protein